MADRLFTDLELERLIAGDLPAARTAEIESKATSADNARLAELRAEHAAFLGTVDVAAEVRAIGRKMQKLEPERPRLATWWRWLFTGGALAAAAAAIIIFVGRRGDKTDEDDLQIKGGDITLTVHLATDSASKRLATGDTVAPGARIRFEVGSVKPGFVTVIGFDAAGATTIYYPFGGVQAQAHDPTAGGLLPGAIALDATPGAEKFYAVFSEHPFTVDTVIPAIKAGGAMPSGVHAAEVVLRKEPK